MTGSNFISSQYTGRSLRRMVLTIVVACQFLLQLPAQNEQRQIDSLQKILKLEKRDTSKVLLLNEIMILTSDPELHKKCNEQALKICEKNIHNIQERDFYLLYYAAAIINEGYYFDNQNDYASAVRKYLKAQALLEKIKRNSNDSRTALAYLYNNLSAVYQNLGKGVESMDYIRKAVAMFEEVGDLEGTAIACSNLAGQYSDIGEMKLALENYNKSLKIYKEANNKDGVATIYNNIADMYDKKGEEKEAITYYLKSYEFIKQVGNKNSEAYILQNIGICYGETGSIKLGLEYLFKSLKMFEELKDKKGLYYSFSNIGGIYHRDKDYKLAEEYFLKSLNSAVEVNYVPGIGASHYRLGNIFIQKEEFDKAKSSFFKAITILEKTSEYRMWANSLIGLAGTYKKQRVTDSAVYFYKKGLKLADKAQFKLGRSTAIVALADINYTLGNKVEARKLGEEGFKMVKEIGYIVEMKNVSELLYKIYKDLGLKSEALEMHELFVKMNDSIKSEEAQRALIRSQLNKEYEELKAKDSLEFAKRNRTNELTITKNEAQLSKERMVRYTLVIVSIMLIAVAFLFYRNYHKKKQHSVRVEKENTVLEAKNKEKELLMHEIHHRVKNNLQIVSGLLKMPQKSIHDTGALEVMDESRQRIHSISLIHKLLYEKNDLTHINAKEYVNELCHEVLKSFTLPDQQINLKLDVSDVKMEVDQFLPLALILNELLLNSIKYAFKKVDDPEIRIHLEQKEKDIIFNFSDNGKEDASELIKAKNSFGTKMIFSLTSQLNGLINVYFKEGTNISINFKAG